MSIWRSSCIEGGHVEIPAGARIVRAMYGETKIASPNGADVTAIVQQAIQKSRMITVSRNLFGDPYPQASKTLWIEISFGRNDGAVTSSGRSTAVTSSSDVSDSKAVDPDTTVPVDPNAAPNTPGHVNFWVDKVWKIRRSQQDYNAVASVPRAEQEAKYNEIAHALGKPMTALGLGSKGINSSNTTDSSSSNSINNKRTVEGKEERTEEWKGECWEGRKLEVPKDLKVTLATYGSDSKSKDVRSQVTQLIDENSTSETVQIDASNGLFGDSHPGVRKKLKIEGYLRIKTDVGGGVTVDYNRPGGGREWAASCFEGKELYVPMDVQISRAYYGDPRGAGTSLGKDVTDVVNQTIKRGQRKIQAGNGFGDPCPGIRKKLWLEGIQGNTHDPLLHFEGNRGRALVWASSRESVKRTVGFYLGMYDVDQDGTLDSEEAIKLIMTMYKNTGLPIPSRSRVERAFSTMDRNSDQRVSAEELVNFLPTFIRTMIDSPEFQALAHHSFDPTAMDASSVTYDPNGSGAYPPSATTTEDGKAFMALADPTVTALEPKAWMSADPRRIHLDTVRVYEMSNNACWEPCFRSSFSFPDDIVCPVYEDDSPFCYYAHIQQNGIGEHIWYKHLKPSKRDTRVIKVDSRDGSFTELTVIPHASPVDMIPIPGGFAILHNDRDDCKQSTQNRLSCTAFDDNGNQKWNTVIMNNGDLFEEKYVTDHKEQLMWYNSNGSIPFGMNHWEGPDCCRMSYGNGKIAIDMGHANNFKNDTKPHGCDRHQAHTAFTLDVSTGLNAKLAHSWAAGHSIRIQALWTGEKFITCNAQDSNPAHVHAYPFFDEELDYTDGKTGEKNRIKSQEIKVLPGFDDGYTCRLGGIEKTNQRGKYVIGYAHVPGVYNLDEKLPKRVGLCLINDDLSESHTVIVDDGYAGLLKMTRFGRNYLMAYTELTAEYSCLMAGHMTNGNYYTDTPVFLLVSPEGKLLDKVVCERDDIHIDSTGDFRTLSNGDVAWCYPTRTPERKAMLCVLPLKK